MALNPAMRRRIAQAQVGAPKGIIIRDGQYLMLIKSMKIIDAAVTGVGDMFHGSLRVEQAAAVTQGVEPNAVGSDADSKCNLNTNRSAMGNVKSMIAGALGLNDPANIGEAEWDRILDWVFSDQQPMRGMLIAGSTFRTTIKNGQNAGQPFVGVNWSPVQQMPAEIAQRRAMLDGLDAQKPQTPMQPPPAPQGYAQPYAPQQQGYAPQQAPNPYPQQPQAPYAPQQGYAPQQAPQMAPPQAAPQYAPPTQQPQSQMPQYAPQAPQGYPPQGWNGR